MITILLFILGLVLLLMKKYAGVITIISVLASTYLQMRISRNVWILLVPGYEVSDFGLLIYMFFFFDVFKKHGAKWRGEIQNYVSVFLLFVLVNGLYDCFVGVCIGDVLKYCRRWLFLTIVYIYPYVPVKCILKSFRQMYYITLVLCLLLLFGSVFGLNLHLFKYVGERGIKPPSFSMIFAVAALTGFFRMPLKRRILHFIVFFIPVVLNLKMTYAVTVLLMYMLYVNFQRKIGSSKKLLLNIAVCGSVVALMIVNAQFSERFISMMDGSGLIGKKDDTNTFAFRLTHAAERWNYIARDPVTLLRGIGYVQEKHFNTKAFYVGALNEDNDVVQLDTPDIAWSLFFIRFGMVGLFLYLCMYICIIKAFYKNRKNSRLCYMFALMLVFLCFTSMGNAIIAFSDFFIYPILMLNLCTKVLYVKKIAVNTNKEKTEAYENSTCALVP